MSFSIQHHPNTTVSKENNSSTDPNSLSDVVSDKTYYHEYCDECKLGNLCREHKNEESTLAPTSSNMVAQPQPTIMHENPQVKESWKFSNSVCIISESNSLDCL